MNKTHILWILSALFAMTAAPAVAMEPLAETETAAFWLSLTDDLAKSATDSCAEETSAFEILNNDVLDEGRARCCACYHAWYDWSLCYADESKCGCCECYENSAGWCDARNACTEAVGNLVHIELPSTRL